MYGLMGALLLAGSCAECGWALGGGAGRHDRVHEVEQLEQQWRSAELAGDATAMDRMLADDYMCVTLQGKVNTKAQQLRRMRDRRSVLERMDLSDVKVRLLGEVAVVTGKARVAGQSSGLSLDGTYRYTQVLRQTPAGAWLMTNFEARREKSHGMPMLVLSAHGS